MIDSLRTADMDVDLQERYQRALAESVERDVRIKEEFQVVKGMETLLKHLQCDVPYRGHPTNIFYKLANQGTPI